VGFVFNKESRHASETFCGIWQTLAGERYGVWLLQKVWRIYGGLPTTSYIFIPCF